MRKTKALEQNRGDQCPYRPAGCRVLDAGSPQGLLERPTRCCARAQAPTTGEDVDEACRALIDESR